MTFRFHSLAGTVLILVMVSASAEAQTPPASRPAIVMDAGAIRKQAAQLGETRALLADPDPNVRLLAIRELAKSGDPIQRQLAIDAGLSSAETAMQEVALRAVVADTQQITITLFNVDGSPIKDGDATLSLHVDKFEQDSGRLSGYGWSGQIQGSVFSLGTSNGRSGSLVWNAETGEFVGTYNIGGATATGIRKAVWRPR